MAQKNHRHHLVPETPKPSRQQSLQQPRARRGGGMDLALGPALACWGAGCLGTVEGLPWGNGPSRHEGPIVTTAGRGDRGPPVWVCGREDPALGLWTWQGFRGFGTGPRLGQDSWRGGEDEPLSAQGKLCPLGTGWTLFQVELEEQVGPAQTRHPRVLGRSQLLSRRRCQQLSRISGGQQLCQCRSLPLCGLGVEGLLAPPS